MAVNVIEAYKTQRNMDRCGVAWFKFDEPSGNVLDSKGTVVGTINGATRVTGWNGEGYALSFDGVDDYVQFSSKVIPLGKKVIKIKLKFDAIPISGSFFSILDNAGGTGNHGDSIIISDNGKIRWISNKGVSGATRFTIESTNNICDGKWHTILLEWNGTTNDNAVKMYVDNMKTPNAIGKTNAIETVTQTYNLILGKWHTSNSLNLKGQIDDLEIYNDMIDLSPIERILIKNNVGVYVYYRQSDNTWQPLDHEPTDEDFLNLGVDKVTKAHIQQLGLQGIKGRKRIRRL